MYIHTNSKHMTLYTQTEEKKTKECILHKQMANTKLHNLETLDTYTAKLQLLHLKNNLVYQKLFAN
jgi:hypothetical protein